MRSVLLVVALVLALAPAASAQAVNKSVELLPGGRTIGGPGAFQGVAGNLEFLYNSSIATGLSFCTTLANVGAVVVSITQFPAGGGSTFVDVDPGLTHVLCGQNLITVAATCAPGTGTCKYMWRLDSL